MPDSEETIEWIYTLDCSFLDVISTLTYDTVLDFDVLGFLRVGYSVENPDSVSAHVDLMSFAIWNYDETVLQNEIIHPSSVSGWEIIESTVVGGSINFLGDRINNELYPSEIHSVLLDTSISIGMCEPYTLLGTSFHNIRDSLSGMVYHAEDTENYYMTTVNKNGLRAKTFRVVDGIPTELDDASFDPNVDTNVDFTIKDDIDTSITIHIERDMETYDYTIIL